MKVAIATALAVVFGALVAADASALTVYVSNEKDNSISVIDAETMKVTATVPVGQRPRGIILSKDGRWDSNEPKSSMDKRCS